MLVIPRMNYDRGENSERQRNEKWREPCMWINWALSSTSFDLLYGGFLHIFLHISLNIFGRSVTWNARYPFLFNLQSGYVLFYRFAELTICIFFIYFFYKLQKRYEDQSKKPGIYQNLFAAGLLLAIFFIALLLIDTTRH